MDEVLGYVSQSPETEGNPDDHAAHKHGQAEQNRFPTETFA